MEIDFHIHSNHSFDSHSTVAAILCHAKEIGLDGVAIVDHGTPAGGYEAMGLPEKERHGLVIIPGMEIMTAFGDILGLFVTRPINTTEPLEVILEMRRQGALIVLPHPYFSELPGQKHLLEHFDAIESCNGRHQMDGGLTVEQAQKQIERFAKKHNLAVLGGSDAHTVSEIGAATTLVEAQSTDDIRDAIEQKLTTVQHGEASRFRKFFFGA